MSWNRRLRMIISLPVVLLFFLLPGCASSPSLLSQELDQVRKVKVTTYMEEIREYDLEDQNMIKELYESVAGTQITAHPNPGADGEQNSDPIFVIAFEYKDGSNETISTTETGKFIYKRLSGAGWTGGRNDTLLTLVNNLSDH